MQVLGLVGSPRKNSNTDLAGSQIFDGANTNNYVTAKLYLYDLGIKPCIDCRTCKKAITNAYSMTTWNYSIRNSKPPT